MIMPDDRYGRWVVVKQGKSRKTLSGQSKTYWQCLCECGTIKEVYSNSLLSGKSLSCGCYKTRIKIPHGVSAMRNMLASYRSKCNRKGIVFNLSEKEFSEITKLPCFYCAAPPKNKARGYKNRGDYQYNGIDRIDNNLGYTKLNVVPSCKNCNLAKRDLSQSEFFGVVRAIYEKHLK